MRVASRIARQRMEAARQTSFPPAPGAVTGPSPQDYAERARAVGVGTRRFGHAIFGPFVRVSSILWSEITGVFFALFAVFFAQGAFRLRTQWAVGPDHAKLLLYGALTLLFAYFCLSSFYRARKKEKRQR